MTLGELREQVENSCMEIEAIAELLDILKAYQKHTKESWHNEDCLCSKCAIASQ